MEARVYVVTDGNESDVKRGIEGWRGKGAGEFKQT